jgi:hypothetical protein
MINAVLAAARFFWKVTSEATWTEGAYSKISRLKAAGNPIFEATHVPTGIRSRFKVVEHDNLGRGYMIRDTEGKIKGIISEWSLMNIKAIYYTRGSFL